jgi:hypothetical protein
MTPMTEVFSKFRFLLRSEDRFIQKLQLFIMLSLSSSSHLAFAFIERFSSYVLHSFVWIGSKGQAELLTVFKIAQHQSRQYIPVDSNIGVPPASIKEDYIKFWTSIDEIAKTLEVHLPGSLGPAPRLG